MNVVPVLCWYWCVGMLETSEHAGRVKETKRVQIEGPMANGALATGGYGIKFHIN